MSLIGLLDLLCLPYHFVCLTHFVYLTITAYFTWRLFDSFCLLDSVVGWLPLSGWHTCLYSLLTVSLLDVVLVHVVYFTLTTWLVVYLTHLVCFLRSSVDLLYLLSPVLSWYLYMMHAMYAINNACCHLWFIAYYLPRCILYVICILCY
jgi:hypothetical protein